MHPKQGLVVEWVGGSVGGGRVDWKTFYQSNFLHAAAFFKYFAQSVILY